MNIIQTSKGPLNVDHYCRMAPETDQGEVIRLSFFTVDGGRVSLPVPEGERLAAWLSERAVFDTREARHA